MSSSLAWILALALWMVSMAEVATAAGPVALSRNAVDFDRCRLSDPAQQAVVKEVGNLGGKGGVSGWFEYDFVISQAGWYELLVTPNGDNHEFFVDSDVYLLGVTGTEKAGNLWLEAGAHRLRIQRNHWTGFAGITQWSLRFSESDISKCLRIQAADGRNVVPAGGKLQLDVFSGGSQQPITLSALVKTRPGQELATKGQIALPAGAGLKRTRLSIPAPREGSYAVTFTVNDTPLELSDVPPVEFTVVDSTPPAAGGDDLERTLIGEVDCVANAPEYVGGGETRIVRKSWGAYRESNDVGWLDHMNATDPSWFAYKLSVPEIQRPYLFEVDYPDDALRTFCISVREGTSRSYPTTGGVDSGGEFSLSNRMQTHTILHWAKATDLRVAMMVPRTGRRAAASKIRVYRIEGDLPALKAPRTGGRSFANWYEEGTSYLGIYGVSAQGNALGDALIGAERWARCVAYMGGDTLWYTPVIYQFGLYPSRYNVSYTSLSSPDTIRVMLLKCEKYGLGLISEFHPEARECAWPRSASDAPNQNLLISKEGNAGRLPTRNGDGPSLNPLAPDVQDWYVGMIGEFVDRYKDSPALRGVSLRVMGWCNPTLNNFHSLDWGYDDETIRMFEKDTGLKVAVTQTGPERFRLRYDWLTINERDRWILWRCQRMTQLHQRIADRVRQARPDLVVYVNVFFDMCDDLREAGLDVSQLNAIEGLRVVNATHAYGRQSSDEQNLKWRNNLINPDRLASMAGKEPGAFLFSSKYFEATEVVAAPGSMGLPTSAAASWTSGVVNPAGRHYLERWALALAECDANFLSDGGNAYTLGQPLLRDFLREYRQLPADAFHARPDARDPVAVWELARPGEFVFYAVNRERFPASIKIHLAEATQVTRLSTGAPVSAPDGLLSLQLQPYELLAFKAKAPARIREVRTVVPPDQMDRAKRQVRWLEQLAIAVQAEGALHDALGSRERKRLVWAAEMAAVALKEGRIWRVRTLLEDDQLNGIFSRAGREPPLVRDLGSTRVPPGAITATELQKLVQANQAKLSAAEASNGNWSLDQVLATSSPTMTLDLPVEVDGRYRLTLGHVSGEKYGPIEMTINGRPVGTLTGSELGAVTSELAEPVSLQSGTARIQLRRTSGDNMAIGFIHLSPILSDITASHWLACGPFPGSEADIAGTLAKVYAPEQKLDVAAPVQLSDGRTLPWVTIEPDTDFVDLGGRFSKSAGQIAYALTQIESHKAKRVRLVYSMDYWMKMWLNGQVVATHATRPGGAPIKGQLSQDVTLRPGRNVLLLKVASGSLGNGFWMAITDPGDLKIMRPATAPSAASKAILLGDRNFQVTIATAMDEYRAEFGPRFDQLGAVTSVKFNGKASMLGRWGLVDEFDLKRSPPGFDGAREGEGFLKIGVGELVKNAEPSYQFWNHYELRHEAPVAMAQRTGRIAFSQSAKLTGGWAYEYAKEFSVIAEKATLVISYELKNSGTRPLDAEQYNHNWLQMGETSPGPADVVQTRFPLALPPSTWFDRDGEQICLKAVAGPSHAESNQPSPAALNSLTVRNSTNGAGVTISGDAQVARFALYADTTALCPEVFVRIRLNPGETRRWTRTYCFTQ